MSTEIVSKETGEVTLVEGFNPTQVDLIKRTVCRGATDDELLLFLHICHKSGLDPFAKQIYAIKRKVEGREVMTFQTSVDGYRAIAERTGNYSPGKEASFTYKADGSVESATAYIHKMAGDVWFEISSTAFFDEYCPKWWDSKDAKWKTPSMWEKMPRVMLAKCAESAVLRKAFPNEMSGTYTADEMAQSEGSNHKPVPMPKAKEIPQEKAHSSAVDATVGSD